jgi:formylglycine-generating enzyme required for sulfatase activity
LRPIVTYEGIDEALKNLRYTNKNSLKSKLINTIREQYQLGGGSVDSVNEIDTDFLVKTLWDTGDDHSLIRSRRKNFNSIKSTVNSDLKKLYSDGLNKEGIIINQKNIFDMSDEAKSEMLESFSYGGQGNSQIPLDKITDVLSVINDFISNKESGIEANEKFEQLKELIRDISGKVGISVVSQGSDAGGVIYSGKSPHQGPVQKISAEADGTIAQEEQINEEEEAVANLPDEIEEVPAIEIEDLPEEEIVEEPVDEIDDKYEELELEDVPEEELDDSSEEEVDVVEESIEEAEELEDAAPEDEVEVIEEPIEETIDELDELPQDETEEEPLDDIEETATEEIDDISEAEIVEEPVEDLEDDEFEELEDADSEDEIEVIEPIEEALEELPEDEAEEELLEDDLEDIPAEEVDEVSEDEIDEEPVDEIEDDEFEEVEVENTPDEELEELPPENEVEIIEEPLEEALDEADELEEEPEDELEEEFEDLPDDEIEELPEEELEEELLDDDLEDIPVDEVDEVSEDEIDEEQVDEIDNDEYEEIEGEDAPYEELEEIPEDAIEDDEFEDIEIGDSPDEELEEDGEDEVDIIEEPTEESLDEVDEIEDVPEEELEDISEDEAGEELLDDDIEEVPADETDEVEEVPEEELEELPEEVIEEPADEPIIDFDDLDEIPEDELEEVPEDEIAELLEDDDYTLAEMLEDYDTTGYLSEEGQEKALILADRFDKMLSDTERYYNRYLLIPGGRFLAVNAPSKADNKTQKYIELPDFYFGKFPVTNNLFELFIEKTGYITTAERQGYSTVYKGRYRYNIDEKSGRKILEWNSSLNSEKVDGACWYQPHGPGSTVHGKRNHPVVQVTLEDAMAFAAWTGKRLPTEQEWEAAARTSSGLDYPWGKKPDKEKCNIEASAIGETTPVDKYQKAANKYEIYDLLGNVMEWTASSESQEGNVVFIAKGGSWVSGDNSMLTSRSLIDPKSPSNIVGFRCITYK